MATGRHFPRVAHNTGFRRTRVMNFYHLRGLLLPHSFDLHGGLNTVGRNPTNDVVIHEASVSAFHAEISIDERGVIVRDLQSTNGSFIDDEPITEKEIRSGQVVQFGTVALKLGTEEIRISVPKLPDPSPEPAALPSGAEAPCSINASLPATHRCVKCQRAFHESSLRTLRISAGAAVMLFCPECSAQVKPIPGVDPRKSRRPGILARLTQTIQLGLRKPK